MTAHGHVHWTELNTRDAEKAKSFLGPAMAWTFDEMSMGPGAPYWICKAGDEMVAGIFTMDGPEFEGLPEHWMVYFAVDDIDVAVEAATKAGGTVLKPIFDLPNTGRIAVIKEPGGAVAGWMTPA